MRFAILAILVSVLASGSASGQESVAAGRAPVRTPGSLIGKAVGAGGAGLAGVAVKLFEEGFLLSETRTGADGSYDLEVDYLPDIDWTLMVWFVPQDAALIPEIVILRESLRSREMGLWSGCLPRIDLQSRMSFDAVLVDEEQKLEQMTKMDCMRGTGQ